MNILHIIIILYKFNAIYKDIEILSFVLGQNWENGVKENTPFLKYMNKFLGL